MTGRDRRAVRLFVERVCGVLGIDQIPVREDGRRLMTSTTMAALAPDGSEICIRDGAGLDPDLYFAVAHELRHAWQLQEDPDRWMAGYHNAAELSVEAYNMQPAELDANGFAAIVMIELFHIRPLFQGLPEHVVEEIYKTAAKIADELKEDIT